MRSATPFEETIMTELALTKSRVLPPKGLLFALVGQCPLLVASLPLHPSTWEMVPGALLLVLGIVLNIWAERLFRMKDVGVCPFTPVPVLIVRGPYRLTRNPMYLGLVCLNLGVTLLTGVLPNLWSSIAFVIWLQYAFVLPEEAFLRRHLGSAFDEYERRVPRWLAVA
jgi:protein-S-isoprenylcysteine O-methyltransferase Ste14